MAPEMFNETFEDETICELPDRTEMSLVNLNLAAPINAAIAANVLSDGATAEAAAIQQSYIPQVA
jgi:hypothetical protein